MRVLQLVFSLDVGGLEQVVVDLCNNLPDAGVECILGCLSHAGAKAKQTTVEQIWLGGLKQNKRLPDTKVLRSLCRLINDYRIDLIHSHNPTAHLYGALASLITMRPHIHTIHGRGKSRETYKRALLRRMLTRFTDNIVSVSDDVKTKLVQVDRLPDRKIKTILNGVDTDACQPIESLEARKELRRQLGIPENLFVIGSVGRLAAEKNYPLMVDAFSKFHKAYSNSHLVIVGDGSEMQFIKVMIEKLSLQHCCSLPGMRSDISDWMKCFDVFSLSSITEGTSVTLLEALATGVPIVATDVGGNRAVVNPPDCGLIVDDGDSDALSNSWLFMASNVEQYRQMCLSARQRSIQEYSVSAMIRLYKDLYSDFINSTDS